MRPVIPTTLILALTLTGMRAHAENGCLADDFVDRRGLAVVEIANNDPGNSFRYRPRCTLISEGTVVRFLAVPGFGTHPLFAGTIENGMPVLDPSSPIGSITLGDSADRLLAATGEFPFFCDVHYQMGMQGSILVVPELFADGFEGT